MRSVNHNTGSPCNREALLELLSARLLERDRVDTWRHLFLNAGRERVSFRREEGAALAILAAPAAVAEGHLSPDDLSAGFAFGLRDSMPSEGQLVVYPSAAEAIGSAVNLIDGRGARRWRVGLHSGSFIVTQFVQDGEAHQLLLGPASRQVTELARRAAAGTIHISPQGYRTLQHEGHEQSGCMVTTEFSGEEMTGVFLAPTPPRGGGMSTFAGLGTL